MRASTRCQLVGMISARESNKFTDTTDTSKAFYIIAFTVFNPLLAFISIEIYIFNLVRFPLYLPSSNVYYEDFFNTAIFVIKLFFLDDARLLCQAVLAVCTKSPQGQLISVGPARGLQNTRTVLWHLV